MTESYLHQWIYNVPQNHIIYCIGEPISSVKELPNVIRIAHHKEEETSDLIFPLFRRAYMNTERLIFALEIGETDLKKAIWCEYTPSPFLSLEKYPFLEGIEKILEEELEPNLSDFLYKNLEQEVHNALRESTRDDLLKHITDMINYCDPGQCSHCERGIIMMNFFRVLCPYTQKNREAIIKYFRYTSFLPMLKDKLEEIERSIWVKKGLYFDPVIKERFGIWKEFFFDEETDFV